MTKKIKYRPPILFAFLGLGGLYVSYILLRAFGHGEIGFQFLIGLFGLSSFGLGVYFLKKFVERIGSGNLKVTDDLIEIPERWRKREKVLFTEIDRIDGIDSFDKMIRLSSKGQHYLIDGKLMNRNDFQELKDFLSKCNTGKMHHE